MSTSNLPSITEQRQFWNWHWQHAQDRQVINDWSLTRFTTIINILRSLPLEGVKILDLGCGPGWYTEKLAEFGQVTGIDLSPEAIAEAKARAPHITFLEGDIYQMPLPEATFDVVISQEVLSHVENQAKYIERAAQVLKPGGHLILSTDNKFIMDRLGEGQWAPLPPEHIETFLDIRGLKRLLRTHFHVIRSTTVIPIGHRGILRLINSVKLNRVLEVLIPRHYLMTLKERAGLGLTIIVLAQKRLS
jgi:SAM-dependent methyltransferase